MVRLPDAPCLCRVRVTVSEPGPGRVLAPAGDPLLARGSQGAGALLVCTLPLLGPQATNTNQWSPLYAAAPCHILVSIMWHVAVLLHMT